jgi:hypothetical protein
VNLGGWLVTEPFIVPGLYEQYQDTTPRAQDEYTLSQAMGADLAVKMEEHYKTFIVSILAVARGEHSLIAVDRDGLYGNRFSWSELGQVSRYSFCFTDRQNSHWILGHRNI